MPKFCQELGYPEELSSDAQKIVEELVKEGSLVGCQPPTIAGVALYILSNRIRMHAKDPKLGKFY